MENITLTNAEYGIEVTVADHRGGFGVSLRDTDADQFFGVTVVYKTLNEAIIYAGSVVA